MNNLPKLAIVLVLGCGSFGSAQAATVFTDRAAFDAATNAATSQAFADSAIGTTGTTFTFNGVTFDTSLAGDRAIVQDGLFNRAVYLGTGFGGTVTINSNLNAIGLYLGSADGMRSFGYTVNGTRGTFTTLANGANNGKFIGFSDVGPIRVTFDTVREFDIISYVTTTNAVVSGAVPEPATWAMLMIGFGGIGFAMRRRTTVNTRIRFA